MATVPVLQVGAVAPKIRRTSALLQFVVSDGNVMLISTSPATGVGVEFAAGVLTVNDVSGCIARLTHISLFVETLQADVALVINVLVLLVTEPLPPVTAARFEPQLIQLVATRPPAALVPVHELPVSAPPNSENEIAFVNVIVLVVPQRPA